MGNNGSRQQGGDGQQQAQAPGTAAPGSGAAGAQGGQTYAGARTGGGPGLFHPAQDQTSLFPPFPNGPRQVPPTPQLQLTETIRNDVNLKKQTLKLVKVPDNPHVYNLEFTFDAAAACTLSIWYNPCPRAPGTPNTGTHHTQPGLARLFNANHVQMADAQRHMQALTLPVPHTRYLAEEKTDVSNNTLSFETQYPIQPQTAKFEKGLAQVYTQVLQPPPTPSALKPTLPLFPPASPPPAVPLLSDPSAPPCLQQHNRGRHLLTLGPPLAQPLEEGFNLSLVQNRGLMYYHQGSQHFPVKPSSSGSRARVWFFCVQPCGRQKYRPVSEKFAPPREWTQPLPSVSWTAKRSSYSVLLVFPPALKSGVKSSFSLALICTTRRQISASAIANQGPEKVNLILVWGLVFDDVDRS